MSMRLFILKFKLANKDSFSNVNTKKLEKNIVLIIF
jgi:hypothetical protein